MTIDTDELKGGFALLVFVGILFALMDWVIGWDLGYYFTTALAAILALLFTWRCAKSKCATGIQKMANLALWLPACLAWGTLLVASIAWQPTQHAWGLVGASCGVTAVAPLVILMLCNLKAKGKVGASWPLRSVGLIALGAAWVGLLVLAGTEFRWAGVLGKIGDARHYQAAPTAIPVRGPVLVAEVWRNRPPLLENALGIGKHARIAERSSALERGAQLVLAKDPGEITTILLLTYEWVDVGTYFSARNESTGHGYQLDCSISVVDPRLNTIWAADKVSGLRPPFRSSTGSDYGNPPSTADIVAALARLPRGPQLEQAPLSSKAESPRSVGQQGNTSAAGFKPNVRLGAQIDLGPAEINITKVSEALTTPIKGKSSKAPGNKFVVIETIVTAIKGGSKLSSGGFVLITQAGVRFNEPGAYGKISLFDKLSDFEATDGAAVYADKVSDPLNVFFEVPEGTATKDLQLLYVAPKGMDRHATERPHVSQQD